jgi:hypothetical protein
MFANASVFDVHGYFLEAIVEYAWLCVGTWDTQHKTRRMLKEFDYVESYE